MSNVTGSYIYISLSVDVSSVPHQLEYAWSSVAWMQDATSPMISVYRVDDNPDGSVKLPDPAQGEQFGFCIGYGGGTGSGYTWSSDPLQSLAIATTPATPVFGQSLPDGFIGPKQNGGLMTFIDTNQVPGMQYEYSVALYPVPGGPYDGMPPIVYDPRIINSKSTNR